MARVVNVATIVLGSLAGVVVGALGIEVGFIAATGRGIFLPGGIHRSVDWYARHDLLEMLDFCEQYSRTHANQRPSPEVLARNVPVVRPAERQPYVDQRLYVLESVRGAETYLYWPYDAFPLFEPGFKNRIYACNAGTLPTGDGRCYAYLRDRERDWYIALSDTGYTTLQTRGIPPVPGCLRGGEPEENHIEPMSAEVARALQAYYPGVQIPPEMLAKEEASSEAEP